jgi:pyruvate ferredoxin oxidoreductase gamma subunit
MFQIGVSGRGGQGVGTAAGLLAVAAFIEGKYARAFPGPGPRPLGAPVVSFCRISDATIRPNEPVTQPDALIIQDPTLLQQPGLLAGLSTDGYLLVNSMRDLGDLGLEPYVTRMRAERLLVLPATQLSLDHLGQPLPGAALLGGFAALTGQVGLDSVAAAISERFTSRVAEGNVAAATAAFGFVEARQREFAARVGA